MIKRRLNKTKKSFLGIIFTLERFCETYHHDEILQLPLRRSVKLVQPAPRLGALCRGDPCRGDLVEATLVQGQLFGRPNR